MFQVHKKPVFALHINPGDVLDVRECKTPNCDLIFAENHLGMRGHVDPKNVSPENIPLHCIFCLDVREFLTETSLQRYLYESLSFCLSVCLSFCLSVSLSFCLSVSLYCIFCVKELLTETSLQRCVKMCMFSSVSFCLSVLLSVYLHVSVV